MIKKIIYCRVCNCKDIKIVLDLGDHSLSGVFPKEGEDQPIKGPLQLGICQGCSLVQLLHSYPPEMMYGDNYGYRSGLNGSMVKHLQSTAIRIHSRYAVENKSVILDIGSNDGTLLNSLVQTQSSLIGIDPTSEKFSEFYNPAVQRIASFFTEDNFLNNHAQADVIFSMAMFYDLEEPVEFVKQISNCLKKDGVWHFEQSYLISMLDTNSFDTICHEHVEYYSFQVIERILEMAGMRVVDIELNNTNGGSLAVTAAHVNSKHPESMYVVWLRRYEAKKISDLHEILGAFAQRVVNQKEIIREFVFTAKEQGKKIWGVGASTKGNFLLQYCDLNQESISAISEVNPYKFDRYTPGTNIPIKSEQEMLMAMPDIGIVLPWHFKESIIGGNKEFLERGGRLVFPLPNIDIVS